MFTAVYICSYIFIYEKFFPGLKDVMKLFNKLQSYHVIYVSKNDKIILYNIYIICS